MALSMTDCHLSSRSRYSRLSSTCDFDTDVVRINWADPQSHQLYPKAVAQCLQGLSDLTFQIYIEFLNHIETICFHIHAKLWQERTDMTVKMLLATTDNVNKEILIASKQHEQLMLNQEFTIEQQRHIMDDWQRLQLAIDAGQQSLASAFDEIKQDVEREHQKVQDIFDELFDVFHKVLSFQKSIKTKIFDLQSVLIYGGLLLATQYLTNGPRVIRARVSIFLILTLMCGMEFFLLRLSGVVFTTFTLARDFYVQSLTLIGLDPSLRLLAGDWDDETALIRKVITWNRFIFIGCALYIYIRCYWSFKDPQAQLVEAVTQKLNTLHAMIEDRLVEDTGYYSQSTDLVDLDSSQGTSKSSWIGTWFGSSTSSTASSLKARKRTDRFFKRGTYLEEKYVKSHLGDVPEVQYLLSTENTEQFLHRLYNNALVSKIETVST